MVTRFFILIVCVLTVFGCSKDSHTPIRPGTASPPTQQQPQGGSGETDNTHTNQPQGTGPNTFNGNPTDLEVGDWDSHGAPVIPRDPVDHSFHFLCKAYLQDQLQRKASFCVDCESLNYRLFRYYEFEVNDENPSVNFLDIDFRKIAYFSLDEKLENNIYEVEEDLQLQAPVVKLNFSFVEGLISDSADLKLQVHTTVAQSFNGKSFFQHNTHEMSGEFGANLKDHLDIRNQQADSNDAVPQLLVEIKCRNFEKNPSEN